MSHKSLYLYVAYSDCYYNLTTTRRQNLKQSYSTFFFGSHTFICFIARAAITMVTKKERYDCQKIIIIIRKIVINT